MHHSTVWAHGASGPPATITTPRQTPIEHQQHMLHGVSGQSAKDANHDMRGNAHTRCATLRPTITAHAPHPQQSTTRYQHHYQHKPPHAQHESAFNKGTRAINHPVHTTNRNQCTLPPPRSHLGSSRRASRQVPRHGLGLGVGAGGWRGCWPRWRRGTRCWADEEEARPTEEEVRAIEEEVQDRRAPRLGDGGVLEAADRGDMRLRVFRPGGRPLCHPLGGHGPRVQVQVLVREGAPCPSLA